MKSTPVESTTTATIRPLDDKFNTDLKALGLAKIAQGNPKIIIHKQRKDEFDAKIDTAFKDGHKQGYHDGMQAQRDLVANRRAKRIRNDGAAPPGRPPKYPFSTLKVGDTMTVDQQHYRRVYHAARQWAWRNAPSRKFSVRAVDDGTTITRTA